ncbi:hypothetical protein ACFSJU_07735 [Paradesertivirga mongoliensis]|uniref:Prepilin type IV endopeptidase peptidase domain-containing protein n=1 Tax=Paradesertivirga mongoliensis TaxID=2100740 RepID=A0ABW4ZKM1_9SPHI|nr:hypothetical protein [Pedobacter mongoliensis]
MLIKTLLIAGLLFVFYQDLRYRAVYWVLFPALLGLLVLLGIQERDILDLTLSSTYNLAFLLLQLLVLFIYFSVKAGRFVNITSGYLGWGDVLFLLCIAFYLSPVNYLLFYILSLVLVLLGALLIYTFRHAQEIKIPLAGLQAILFASLLVTDWNLKILNITNDHWLLNYLSQ